MNRTKTTKKAAPKQRAPRINWRLRALAAEQKLPDVRELCRNGAREAMRGLSTDIDILKARLFDALPENSPWLKQNNQVRKLIEQHFSARTSGVKSGPTVILREIAKVLSIPTPVKSK